MPLLHVSPRFNSVRGRLVLLIAALVVPATAIIATLTWESYRAQQDSVRTQVLNTARAVAGVVDAELDRSVTQLSTLIATASVQRGDWEGVDAIARRFLPNGDRWLVITDMSGRQLVNTHIKRGDPIPNIRLDPKYLEAMRAGDRFVSNMVEGPAAKRLIVHVGLPFTTKGELFGMSIVMGPEYVAHTLGLQRYAPEGVVTVADRTGRIIARNPGQEAFVGGYMTSDLVSAMGHRAEGVGESVTLERIPVLMAFSHARNGWGVAIGTPKERVFAAGRSLFIMAIVSSLTVTLVAVLIAAWIARAVLRNVDELASDAERLARGEPPQYGQEHLQEIRIVAAAMQRMAATKNEAQAQLREARDRLQRYADELEKKVEERTASLREAVAQMEEFSYTVSHDLRAPIRAIQGYADVLLEDTPLKDDPGAREYLRRIVNASDRMTKLTSALLSYSRVAKADLQRQRIALEPLIRQTVEQYTELHAPSAEVRIVTPMPEVVAHEVTLTQALANLLTNAAKFVRPGERPKITVRSERRGDRVRVWIEDNGIGIPPAHQARLFKIFERAPGATAYDGTGVGLAIVRRIVEKSGGACGVESDGQNGSRFWIELPAP